MHRETLFRAHSFIDIDAVRAEGSRIFDAPGRKVLDMESGIWCAVLGHGHPRIVSAAKKQMDLVVHLGTRIVNSTVVSAAEELLSVCPMPGGRVVFLTSGSESVEFGIRAARQFTNRPSICVIRGSYLGAFGMAGHASGVEPGKGVVSVDLPDCSWCRSQVDPPPCSSGECRECLPELEGQLDSVAAFVLEPILVSGGIIVPPAGFVRKVAGLVKERGGLVMSDEVTCGFGRTGGWFGFQLFGLYPDIVAVGKGLGNGFPVSACIVKGEIEERLFSRNFRYVQSHQFDPFGCAVAREVIKVIKEEALIERGRSAAERLWAGLEGIRSRGPLISEMRGSGLLVGIELARKGELTREETCSQTTDRLLERGILVGVNPKLGLIRLLPPLIISDGEIDFFMSEFEESLQ
ncbi:MAG: aspartate aminotransferase family protein [Bacillota bacterium]